ncbi:pentatricopeptide repeat-containing protein [Tanacetum coccineum]
MALLHDDLKLQQDTRLTLISDGHKGLHDAVRDWLPNSEHKKCTRHIYANFKKKFSGIQLQKLLWHAASCTVPQLFYSKMEEMNQINSEAYDYLIGRDPNSWSRAFFNLSIKCHAFENGICESYHKVILLQRHKPIITMLENIRVYLMQRVVAMHNIAVNLEDQITPTVRKKLEYLKREQRHWTVFLSAYQLLEVRCGDSAFGVNLGEKTCTCRLWKLSGIQCIHVVAGYMHLNRDPD